MKKTKYRIVSNGYKYFLEYETTVKLFFVFPIKVWTGVDKAYRTQSDDRYQSAYNKEYLEKLTIMYPDVSVLLAKVAAEQSAINEKHRTERLERDNKRNEVTYL